MYQAMPMYLIERFRQSNGDAQEVRQIERLPLIPPKNPIQGLTARIREYKEHPAFVTSQSQRSGCPSYIEVGGE
jgi:hypothetical protein